MSQQQQQQQQWRVPVLLGRLPVALGLQCPTNRGRHYCHAGTGLSRGYSGSKSARIFAPAFAVGIQRCCSSVGGSAGIAPTVSGIYRTQGARFGSTSISSFFSSSLFSTTHGMYTQSRTTTRHVAPISHWMLRGRYGITGSRTGIDESVAAIAALGTGTTTMAFTCLDQFRHSVSVPIGCWELENIDTSGSQIPTTSTTTTTSTSTTNNSTTNNSNIDYEWDDNATGSSRSNWTHGTDSDKFDSAQHIRRLSSTGSAKLNATVGLFVATWNIAISQSGWISVTAVYPVPSTPGQYVTSTAGSQRTGGENATITLTISTTAQQSLLTVFTIKSSIGVGKRNATKSCDSKFYGTIGRRIFPHPVLDHSQSVGAGFRSRERRTFGNVGTDLVASAK